MDDPAQYISTTDLAFGFRRWYGDGNLLIDALMGASLVVVLGVLAHGLMQMGLIDDQNLVQTFFAHGAHPSFGVGISIWGLVGGSDDADAF